MLLTLKEISEMCGVSEIAIRYLCKTGKVPYKKIGNKILFEKEQVEFIKQSYKPSKKGKRG